MESIADGRYLADFSLVDQPTIGLRLSGFSAFEAGLTSASTGDASAGKDALTKVATRAFLESARAVVVIFGGASALAFAQTRRTESFIGRR